jgi:hypothetical protein
MLELSLSIRGPSPARTTRIDGAGVEQLPERDPERAASAQRVSMPGFASPVSMACRVDLPIPASPRPRRGCGPPATQLGDGAGDARPELGGVVAVGCRAALPRVAGSTCSSTVLPLPCPPAPGPVLLLGTAVVGRRERPAAVRASRAPNAPCWLGCSRAVEVGWYRVPDDEFRIPDDDGVPTARIARCQGAPGRPRRGRLRPVLRGARGRRRPLAARRDPVERHGARRRLAVRVRRGPRRRRQPAGRGPRRAAAQRPLPRVRVRHRTRTCRTGPSGAARWTATSSSTSPSRSPSPARRRGRHVASGSRAGRVVTAWIGATALGAYGGQLLGDPERFGLDAAFPAGFLALLAPWLRDRAVVSPPPTGVLLALALTPITPPGVPILAAGLGAVVAMRLPAHPPRRTSTRRRTVPNGEAHLRRRGRTHHDAGRAGVLAVGTYLMKAVGPVASAGRSLPPACARSPSCCPPRCSPRSSRPRPSGTGPRSPSTPASSASASPRSRSRCERPSPWSCCSARWDGAHEAGRLGLTRARGDPRPAPWGRTPCAVGDVPPWADRSGGRPTLWTPGRRPTSGGVPDMQARTTRRIAAMVAAGILLAGCGTPLPRRRLRASEVAAPAETPVVVVHKTETCTCCGATRSTSRSSATRSRSSSTRTSPRSRPRSGSPDGEGSCHTNEVAGTSSRDTSRPRRSSSCSPSDPRSTGSPSRGCRSARRVCRGSRPNRSWSAPSSTVRSSASSGASDRRATFRRRGAGSELVAGVGGREAVGVLVPAVAGVRLDPDQLDLRPSRVSS